MKLGLAIDEVQDAELDLAKQLIALAERHQQESDVYHTGLARAHVCADHIWQLRPFVEAYEAHSVNIGEETTPGLLDTLRQGLKAIGLTPVSGVALLHDLRDGVPESGLELAAHVAQRAHHTQIGRTLTGLEESWM